jgi:signal peptidase I
MIVTFKAPPDMEKEYVKRVIALPGETIRIQDKRVFINGQPIHEPYVYFRDAHIDNGIRDNYPTYKIPPNYYFCMGDNRDNSYDSRFWGPVPADYIIGKPWRIYWSFASTSSEYMASGVNKLRDLFSTFFNFFSKTRWDRTIKRIS